MSHKISICAITYNSIRYLPDFIDSIFEQTYFTKTGQTPDIFIIDNASIDTTVKFIKDHYPTVHLLRNINNIGTSRAWNQAIQMTSGEYILIMNPDLLLHKDFITQALKVIQSDQTIASLAGKLYQLKISNINQDELPALEKTSLLDSCGFQAFKNRRFIERGSGQIDTGQFNQAQEIFGSSGACALYRRAALEQIKFNQEYFDTDFFLYKEDIDLAWRLRLAGWSSVYAPQAIAYHYRRARSQGSRVKNLEVAKHRLNKDSFVNHYSYRNHLMLLYKNSLCINVFKHFPYIFFYELKKFIYVLLLENSTLRQALLDLFRFRKKIKQKRRVTMHLKHIKAKEMAEWFN